MGSWVPIPKKEAYARAISVYVRFGAWVSPLHVFTSGGIRAQRRRRRRGRIRREKGERVVYDYGDGER